MGFIAAAIVVGLVYLGDSISSIGRYENDYDDWV